MTDSIQCQTCQHSGDPDEVEEWHHYLHPFNPLGTLSAKDALPKATPEPQQASAGQTVALSPWPFDPVLRQALINKGVLTPEDLRDAELQIRMVSGEVIAK